MSDKQCKGCGEKLQSEDKNLKGYVPFEKLLLQDNLICQNCFRLKNYGKIPEETMSKKEYKDVAIASIKEADIVLGIFDAVDIESSMVTEILDLLDEKESIVVLNKIDLLEKNYTMPEISSWFRKKIIENNIFPQSFCFVSSKTNEGINGILHKIKDICGKKQVKVCVLGASNVGKSSLLNRLIGSNKLTTSKYSGTTKRSIKTTVKYKDIKITFIDTPGIVPEGRMNEMLPKDKAVLLLNSKSVQKNKVRLNEGQYLTFSNLIYIKVENKCELDCYASKNIQFHVTNKQKVDELMTNGFFTLLSKEETDEYYNHKFVIDKISLTRDDALDILGLGYVEANSSVTLSIKHPEEVKVIVREKIKYANKRQDEML